MKTPTKTKKLSNSQIMRKIIREEVESILSKKLSEIEAYLKIIAESSLSTKSAITELANQEYSEQPIQKQPSGGSWSSDGKTPPKSLNTPGYLKENNNNNKSHTPTFDADKIKFNGSNPLEFIAKMANTNVEGNGISDFMLPGE